jgi:hypothetical protein
MTPYNHSNEVEERTFSDYWNVTDTNDSIGGMPAWNFYAHLTDGIRMLYGPPEENYWMVDF